MICTETFPRPRDAGGELYRPELSTFDSLNTTIATALVTVRRVLPAAVARLNAVATFRTFRILAYLPELLTRYPLLVVVRRLLVRSLHCIHP